MKHASPEKSLSKQAEVEIFKKIQELFASRHIPQLITMAGLDDNNTFLRQLKDLQLAIYQLDQFLESNWSIEAATREHFWEKIRQCLSSLEIPDVNMPAFLWEIMQYEFFELEMRRQRYPVDRSIFTTYYTKSCDVRLLRRLIKRAAQKDHPTLRPNYWDVFDIATEILDDIEDLTEDLETYNGNRWMFALMLSGPSLARQEYMDFVRQLSKLNPELQIIEHLIDALQADSDRTLREKVNRARIRQRLF